MSAPWRLVVGALATLLSTGLACAVWSADVPGPTPAGAVEVPPPGESAPGAPAQTATLPTKPNLTGSLAFDARWMRSPAVPGGENTTRSDLYVRKIELAVEVPMLRGVDAIAVVNSEWIGDGMNPNDGALGVDEAHLDLEGKHAYLVVGQRTQPFGVFESHLVTDPLTQDGYEIKKPGATLGARGPLGADLSLTVYAGRAAWDHFTSSRLIDAAALDRQPVVPDRVSSYVLGAALSPWEERVNLSGAIDSEPGQGGRNTTANLALQLVPHGSNHLMADAELMRALSRETPAGAARAFKETAGSFSLAYVFVVRPRKVRGSANYKARMSRLRAHPVLVCARYEFLDDDGRTDASAIATVRQRTSLGGRYTFHDGDGRGAYASAEYRWTRYRLPARDSPPGSPRGSEIYLRLGISF